MRNPDENLFFRSDIKLDWVVNNNYLFLFETAWEGRRKGNHAETIKSSKREAKKENNYSRLSYWNEEKKKKCYFCSLCYSNWRLWRMATKLNWHSEKINFKYSRRKNERLLMKFIQPKSWLAIVRHRRAEGDEANLKKNKNQILLPFTRPHFLVGVKLVCGKFPMSLHGCRRWNGESGGASAFHVPFLWLIDDLINNHLLISFISELVHPRNLAIKNKKWYLAFFPANSMRWRLGREKGPFAALVCP